MKFHKAAFWLLPICWGIWIIYLSLLPGGAGILTLFGIPHFDKIAHMGAYGIWSILFLIAAQKNYGFQPKRVWAIVLLLCAVGCGLEFGQYYLHQGRSFELLDMAANAAGTIGGAVLVWYKQKNSQTTLAAWLTN